MCGERKLTGLTDTQQGRYLLDDVWDDGAVDYCLGAGQWTFAKRSVEIASSTSVTPAFGFSKAFDIPTDLVRMVSMCSDPYEKCPVLDYKPMKDYWFADVDPLYVSYVSNNASYGGDLTRWPQEFVLFIQSYMASQIIETLTQDENKFARVYKLAKQYRTEAASSDAMEQPTKFLPEGNWTAARRGGGNGDRGSRSRLIG